MQNRYPPTVTTLSLVKSREILQKITTHFQEQSSNREHSSIIQSLQTSSQKVQESLQTRIEENFTQMLNSPSLMPLDLIKSDPPQKENKANTSALEGSKALMYQYWQRNRHRKSTNLNKTASVKNLQIRKSESKLPYINPPNDIKIAQFLKAKEREQQFGEIVVPRTEPIEQFHIKIKINDFKCQNETKSYFKFQKTYFKRWKDIESIVRALERFTKYYNLHRITVQSKAVFELLAKIDKGHKMSTHDLLACCDHAEEISEENCKQAGIRFFGKAGKFRAIVLIQSHVRRYIQSKKFKQMKLEWRSASLIQTYFRLFKLKRATRDRIFLNQLSKLQRYNSFQKSFCNSYRRKQIQSRIKYQIHIPSHNYTSWQKISIQKYLQQQNSELCRIFKVAQSNPLTEVRIIYVSPINISKEIQNYYRKLFQLSCQSTMDDRLIILSPDYNNKLPVSLSLTQLLYYSSRTLNKIKNIIRNQYAYVVPSTPSIEYVNICQYLGVPLYGGSPQKLNYLSTKAGCKTYQSKLNEGEEEQAGILPYSVDIYTQNSFLNELTNLIFRYPYVKRWVLKIDNEINSRGNAYIDISKLLGKLFKKMNCEGEKVKREEIYSILQSKLIINNEERIIPFDILVYPTQRQFLQHFYTRGGIIQASINNLESELQTTCFCVNLQPDGQWSFLCSYLKITNKRKTIGAYYDSTLLTPPLSINSIINQLHQQQLYGYFTFQFLSINHTLEKTMKKNQNKVYYLNSIDPQLNQYSSAHYLRQLISKDSHALFLPMIQHPAIKQLRLQTFFHLCRLQNISFDIQKKVGNVFTFMDGLQSSCLGLMTFNQASRQNCYTQTAEVLQFLNSKLVQSNKLKDVPQSFLSIKNAVNGFLNRDRKQKLKSQISEKYISA